MRDLGRIVRLQIQRSTLKTGEKPTRVYDPTPILAVSRLAVGRDGVLGEGPDGRELVRLDVLQVAHPCRPFSGWALGGMVETDVLKETLQFLDDGTRGFYCVGVGTGIVSVGDRVVVVST